MPEEKKKIAPLSLQAYEQRLIAQKKALQPALTAAMASGEAGKREKLQQAVVAITEALTFLKQSYKNEMLCRKSVLAGFAKLQGLMDSASYQLACLSIQSKPIAAEAEQILDKLVGKGGKAGAFAAFQSGRLAECRMDFSRAAVRYDKAVELDGGNAHYLKAAALLSRKMYQYNKAIASLVAIEKLLVQTGKDSVELALARRELAYTAMLAGQHKQAGEYYKKAMASLAKLASKTDPEMGICWFQVGLLQEHQGNYEQAEGPYKQALAIMEKTDNEMVLAEILDKLGRLHAELEAETDAIPLFERLLAIKTKSPHPDLAGIIVILNNLAEASRICGRYDRSEDYYKQALEATVKLRGKDHPAVGSIYQELAKLCDRQRKKDEANRYNEMAKELFERAVARHAATQDERLTL